MVAAVVVDGTAEVIILVLCRVAFDAVFEPVAACIVRDEVTLRRLAKAIAPRINNQRSTFISSSKLIIGPELFGKCVQHFGASGHAQ